MMYHNTHYHVIFWQMLLHVVFFVGWGGAGLGATEQGIVDPIQSSDVRDKVDMYKGIGHDFKDPFEQFRKSKAQGFIQRMKEKAEASAKK